MKVDRSQYVATHNRNPRGFGLWLFDIHATNRGCTRVQYTGEFKDALASAKSEARSIGGAHTVVVCD